jgi:hypothetical protein
VRARGRSEREGVSGRAPNRLASQRELAIAYRADGQVGKAVELLEHVFAVDARILRDGHPTWLVSQNALAVKG